MGKPASMEARVKLLESDLGRVAVLTRALIDACLKKGVVTQVELAELMKKADASRGRGIPSGTPLGGPPAGSA